MAETDFYNCADVTIGYYGDPEASPRQPRNLANGRLANQIQVCLCCLKEDQIIFVLSINSNANVKEVDKLKMSIFN